MNRTERRKLLKQGYNTTSIIQKCENDAEQIGYKRGVHDTYRTTLLLCAYIARLHFDLDQDGLANFMARLLNCIDSFRTGQLQPQDVHAIADECREYGFDIDIFY